MNMKVVTMALAAVGLSTTVALAQQQDPSRMPSEQPSKGTAVTFASLDRNQDQQLSKKEASADTALAANFAAVDANGDGYISKSEYMANAGPTKEPRSPPPER